MWVRLRMLEESGHYNNSNEANNANGNINVCKRLYHNLNEKSFFTTGEITTLARTINEIFTYV